MTPDKRARAEANFKVRQIQAKDAPAATSEYQTAFTATQEKTARLKAQRLASEEANLSPVDKKPGG
ncbi:MAG: hypothetical protein ABUL48_02585 [Pseudorhodoplanes sp.]